MKEILRKIENSLILATKGQESVHKVIWFWGVGGYIFAYLVANNLVLAFDYRFTDLLISILMIIYFVWHIYAIKKCAPKKLKLTPEEKEKIRIEKRKELGKKFMRKLFLQESITKRDPVFTTIVIDLFCIASFFHYL